MLYICPARQVGSDGVGRDVPLRLTFPGRSEVIETKSFSGPGTFFLFNEILVLPLTGMEISIPNQHADILSLMAAKT